MNLTPRQTRISLLALVSFSVAFVVYVFFFSDAAVQRRNMWIAREHNQVLRTLIAHDPRFTQIEFHDFTGLDGASSAVGSVATEADDAALERIVRDSLPPRPVLWAIEVKEDASLNYWNRRPHHIDAAR